MLKRAVALYEDLRDAFVEVHGAIGYRGALEYAVGREGGQSFKRLGLLARDGLVALHVRGLLHTLYARYGSSDLAVFSQIFVQREYQCLDDIEDPVLVVDCGANVGYSSAYFLNRFPSARVIAIEPESSNVALCRKNLAPYGSRAEILQAAVWPTRSPLRVVRGRYRDGKEWATQVEECSPAFADTRGTTLLDVLERSGRETIDILKVDIEASERVLFSREFLLWLRKTRHIVIELHDQQCEEVFHNALEGFIYELGRSGELTVVKHLSLSSRADIVS